MDPVRRIVEDVFNPNGYDGIWWLGNAGFMIRLGKKYIMVDPAITEEAHTQERLHGFPLEPEEIRQVDCVLYTHEHTDHLDRGFLPKLRELGTTICVPEYCKALLMREGIPESQINVSRVGEVVFSNEGFKIEVIRALHGSRGSLYYQEIGNQDVVACGYLIRTGYGNIFHPGDTYCLEEFSKLSVDYLLLPINDTNLSAGFAAQLTQDLQPKVVIPCHYGMYAPNRDWQGGHPAEYLTALAARGYAYPFTDIMVLKPGGKVVLYM
jgi:L-ascorbate metabolism protein UlaG (beta-lactamase superfamily)